MRLPQPLFRKLGLLLAGLFISLGIAEVIIRVTNAQRYAQRPVFYRKNQRLGWFPEAGLAHTFHGTDFSILIETDKSGYRLGEQGEAPPTSQLVLLSGDSNTFGWGVSTSETYPSQFDELLRARSKGPLLRAINLGVGGYGTIQSALRLDNYLQANPSRHVRAIVFLHTPNDLIDNVRFESVRRGLRKYEECPPNSSPLHLINFVRQSSYSFSHVQSDRPDLLFGVRLAWTDVGRRVMREGYGKDPAVGSDMEFLSIEEVHAKAVEIEGKDGRVSWELDRPTRLQRELLRQSIGSINAAALAREATIAHVVVGSTPDWYAEMVHKLVQQTGGNNQRILWFGRVPVASEYTRPRRNPHSGRHFTPNLNRYYAEKILYWLEQRGCL